MRPPIIRRVSGARGIKTWLFPDIPVPVRIVLGAPGLFEPLMLVAGMIYNQVQDKLHSPRVEFVFQDVDIQNCAIPRVDGLVITNIVALN
jgi:hypothetical protein